MKKKMPTLWNEKAMVYDRVFTEVISYNKANLECVEQNEDRQQAASRTKWRR